MRKFLFGLNDSYDAARAHIIMIDPLADLEKTFNLIIQHEQQSMIKYTPQANSMVFQTSAQPFVHHNT